MFANLGLTEILIIVGSLTLLFGARRLPQLGRDLGQGLRSLYEGVTGRAIEDRSALPPPSSSDQKT
jgi:sec-independent protein translocase protein TatA